MVYSKKDREERASALQRIVLASTLQLRIEEKEERAKWGKSV
jgi:hypothetical protein